MPAWEDELIEVLGVEPVDIQRVALALALAEREGALPPELRAAGGRRPMSRPPDVELLSSDGPDSGALVHLLGESDAVELVGRGLRILDGLALENGRSGLALIERLFRLFQEKGGAGSPLAPARAIALPVAEDHRGHRLDWVINAEGGQQGAPHAGIAGMTGQGKTQLLMQVLAGVAQRSQQTGLLVLDYKGDLGRNEDFVQVTGLRRVRPGIEPLPLNPFHLPDEIPAQLRARALVEVLGWASKGGLGDVQGHRAQQAMQQVYEQVGPRPPLSAIRRAIRRLYEEEGAKPDKVLSALETLTGTRIFAEQPELGPEDFLQGRWLVELNNLPGVEVQLALVLMHWVHQAMRSIGDASLAEWEGRSSLRLRSLRTVIAVDEAHYYLRGRPEPLLNLVRIGRSKGLAVILSTQSIVDFQEHDELREQLPTLFLFRHGQAPPKAAIQGVLGLRSGDEVRRAVDRLLALQQFEILTTAGGANPLEPLRALPFYENMGGFGGKDG